MTARLSQDVLIQIEPLGIVFFDEFDFPQATPFFDSSLE
jgi:hypothetical protein